MIVVVDADQIVYANSTLTQKQVVIVKTPDNKTLEFNKISDFYGRSKKIIQKGCYLYDEYPEEDWQEIVKQYKIENTTQILPDNFNTACHHAESQIMAISRRFPEANLKIVLGHDSPELYRSKLYPMYKNGRREKPHFFFKLKEWFIKRFNNEIVIAPRNMEADDVLSVIGWWSIGQIKKQDKELEESEVILAHVDKDINQVEGWHYDFLTKNVKYWISHKVAYRNFFIQMLIGDKVDHIPSVIKVADSITESFDLRKVAKGCGEKTAKAILSLDIPVSEMFKRVVHVYEQAGYDDWRAEIQKQYRLLRLMESKDEIPDIIDLVERFNLNDLSKLYYNTEEGGGTRH